MPHLKLRPIFAPFMTIGTLLAFLLQPGHDTAALPRRAGSTPSYIQTGQRVESHFQSYSKLLAGYYGSLLRAAQEHAPNLLAQFQAPEPVAYGYQVLPRITADAVPAKPKAARAVAYSWPWTERLIDSERRKIFRSMAELRRAATRAANPSSAILEKLVLDYRSMRDRHSNIDAHVRYNRFWQAAIAADLSAYDRETLLQNDVLEYRSMVETLQSRAAAIERSSVRLETAGPSRGAGIGTERGKRTALLAERIRAALQRIDTPRFITVEHGSDEWIVRVPLFTDIEDQNFIAAVKRIIESTWQITDREKKFRVELDISYVSTALLYADLATPTRGARLDLRRHLGLFPSGGAILTTGALTTHVQDYAIVLGPRAIAPRVLAHEFGHILGFRDGYIRGYRNLGEYGFQILEVVASPGDIMAAPATGLVLPAHFERLIGRAQSEILTRTPQSATATQL